MSTELSFPEGIPEDCRDCPALQGQLEAWRTTQTICDLALQSSLSLSDDEMLELIPDHLVELVGTHNQESLDPANQADRLRVVRFIREQNGATFSDMENIGESIVTSIVNFTDRCGKKGPLKVRVRHSGAVLLRICRGDLADVHNDHPHSATVTLQREP